ncbi:fumarate reductase iron-sulfur subunit [Candidatus Sulfurimonas marisnigri]|uniref:Fumarate reductase iron-sulfur subunit n=1 Tax=Candidatus Sulfurimonas marisnigri TaxID=2740405 RepID=A0A7S7RRI1_9BACT|nr:fumarate reductase iron-sulfur subunit [Candidatus Sulfurimonas marisnigri]QOY55796.1 fumarate reductase iron-sulfur subunit [Candidatus Sulfurimonas marisnigri]
MSEENNRILKISILRFDPNDPEDFPHMQTFEVEEADGMTLFIALNEIREHHDNSLKFDFVCRAGICGSCSMLVNGTPTLACKTLTSKLGVNISLAPLPLFELIGDLSIYTGKWMRYLNQHLETWIHNKEKELNVDKLEERMEPELADEIYELERCIECGCCVAGCGTIQMRQEFVGAVGLNKIARYHLDPRDMRSDEEFYKLIGNEDGVFGCMTLLGCEDVCPKSLPLQTKIAYLRRMMIKTSMK